MTKDVELTFRQQLAEAIGEDRFELWFDRYNSPRWTEASVDVCAPDSFTLEWIQRTFHSALVRLLRQEPFDSHRLEYRLDEALKDSDDSPQAQSAPHQPNLKISRGSERSDIPVQHRARVNQLDKLVEGDHNRMAVAASRHLLTHAGEVTPFFVSGPTGCGKTHLLQALYKDAKASGEYERCAFMSAEQFTSAFLEALHGRGLPSFRAKYRGVDLLIVDDIHFLAGKRATIVEFQHTLDQLVGAKKQVVLSSHRMPMELNELGSELVARLGSGLSCSLEYPTGEAKASLIQSQAKAKGIELSKDVLELLVTEISGDARQLSGALNRLLALRLAGIENPDAEMVREHILDLLVPQQQSVGIQEVETAVCEAFGIEDVMLKSSDKSRQFSQPRMLAMWLARRHTRAALSEIGDYFGGRSHSTVIAAQRTVEKWVQGEKQVGTSTRPMRVDDAIRRIERRLKCC